MTIRLTVALLLAAHALFSTTRGVSCDAAELTVVAGNGLPANNGDQGIATQLGVKDTFGVEIGPDGALYITEVGHHRIRRVDLATQRISTVVGTGEKGFASDGTLATEAKLNEPYEVRFDGEGNLYFVEMQNHLVRRVDAVSKRISTIAGTGKPGYGGDGGRADKAQLHRPHSIALDSQGHLYIADIGNHRIRQVDLQIGLIRTIAGNGEKQLPVNNQLAIGKPLLGPRALFLTEESLWIALREGHSVWRLDLQSGRLLHVAGSGQKGFADGSSQRAQFNGPKGIAVDEHQNVFVVDTENHVIRRIDGESRWVTTIAGSGTSGNQVGDALQSSMNRPHGICLGADGILFVGDTLNHRVAMIQP